MNRPEERTVTFQRVIRGIEVDASGNVNPGWIARMLEAARWEVFGRETFVLRDRIIGGVARAAAFEYHAPLAIGDEVDVETWLARVGSTSYDFGHAIMKDGVAAVRARVTVVHLGPEGPAPVGEDLRSAVIDAPVPPRVEWPNAPREESRERTWLVTPSDQDGFGHVNQARYVDYIDDTLQLLWTSGEARPLRALSLEYLRETHARMTVRMQTWDRGDGEHAFELTRADSGEVHSRGRTWEASI